MLGERLVDEAVTFTGWDSNSGFEVARALLAEHPDLDGILAGSDRIALGVLSALSLAGRRVPQDVSVIGFDDHQWRAPALPHSPP